MEYNIEILISFLKMREAMNPIIKIDKENIFSFFRMDLVSSYLEESVGAYRIHTIIQKRYPMTNIVRL